jgi:hypothetical protein
MHYGKQISRPRDSLTAAETIEVYGLGLGACNCIECHLVLLLKVMAVSDTFVPLAINLNCPRQANETDLNFSSPKRP